MKFCFQSLVMPGPFNDYLRPKSALEDFFFEPFTRRSRRATHKARRDDPPLSVKTNPTDDNPHDPSDRGIVLSNLDVDSLSDPHEMFVSARILTPRFLQYPFHVGGLVVGRHRCGLSGIGFDYDHSR